MVTAMTYHQYNTKSSISRGSKVSNLNGSIQDALTGVVQLDADDEGFESIGLKVSLEDIYAFFKSAIDDYEIGRAKALIK
jgi:hypothetical protein